MSIYEFKAKSASGKDVALSDYRGKPVLIVNVASHCGFTPQYKGLEALYQKYHDAGFVVLGFPCNQFGKQEPGTEAEIQSFCEMNFGVKFPLFKKIEVNGRNADPLYKYLVDEKPGFLGLKRIKWNFTKFLIDKNGKPVKRYAPTVKPEDLEADIEQILKT